MKVSLLDDNKRDLPGRIFYYSNQVPRFSKAPSSGGGDWIWDCLGHKFSSYPSGLRFIRFEDTMQSGTSFPQARFRKGPRKLIVRSDVLEDTMRRGASFSGEEVKGSPFREVELSDGYDVKAFGATVTVAR